MRLAKTHALVNGYVFVNCFGQDVSDPAVQVFEGIGQD